MIIDKSLYRPKNYLVSIIKKSYWILIRVLKIFFKNYSKVIFENESFSASTTHQIPRLTVRENKDLQCNSCMLCVEACPQKCIEIINDKATFARPKKFEVDFNKCIFCSECIEICPIDALFLGEFKFDISGGKKSLVLNIEELKDETQVTSLAENI